MRSGGRPVPGPIAGALLLDTGATRTCIALKAAQELGLQARRMQEGFGANGKYSNQVFLAKLEIRIMDPKTKMVHSFSWEQEVEGIPELHNFAAPLTVNGQVVPVSGLLGRDILKHAKIRYDGPGGKLHFEFDVESIQRQPSR
jgi:predicted aspartyl protease